MRDRQARYWLLVLAIALIMFALYAEADSWFWRSQIRDLQRRVGELEERVNQ